MPLCYGTLKTLRYAMALTIGNYIIHEGTSSYDYSGYITSGEAYFGIGGDDLISSDATAVVNYNGVNWYLCSILSGGAGSDSYHLQVGDNSIIIDGNTGDYDVLNVGKSSDELTRIYTIENRHIVAEFSGGYSYKSVVIVDGLNDIGAMETIKFHDISYNGAPQSIQPLVSAYSSGDFTLEDVISKGWFNTDVMGISSANDAAAVRSTLNEIYQSI